MVFSFREQFLRLNLKDIADYFWNCFQNKVLKDGRFERFAALFAAPNTTKAATPATHSLVPSFWNCYQYLRNVNTSINLKDTILSRAGFSLVPGEPSLVR
jgi:hypothetical protein